MDSFWFHLALYPAASAILIALMAAYDAQASRSGKCRPCCVGGE